MKNVYTAIALILFFQVATAAPRTLITATSNGNWSNKSSWSLKRVPANGDSIVIPQNTTVAYDAKVSLSNVYLVINGTLVMKQATTLNFDKPSTVVIGSAGQIRTVNPGKDNSQKINMDTYDNPIFQGKGVYGGVKGILNGPLMITTNGKGWVVPAQNAPTPLPVKFVSFTVARQQNLVLIQWSTATEINSRDFEIERSSDGTNWTTITSVNAAGQSTALLTYSYTDRSAAGAVVYYRIRQVDLDGAFTYTDVRTIKLENSQADVKVITASPSTLYVSFSQPIQSGVTLRLTSMTGQVISQQQVSNPAGQVQFNAPSHNTGIYVLTITDNKNLKISKQVLL
ncbi:MAG TPA: T9SS type A sorting domain-containing protein [Chitinophagaceae bacterium]|nr:T9SS type A sorting domain-containing protein [Chitinophagaceae bacterium]